MKTNGPDNLLSLEIKTIERKTFQLHLISQIFTGMAFGILMLQDVILKKSLLASDFQVTLLIFLTSSAFLFSIYGPEIINRSNNQSRMIISMAVFSRFFLIIIPLFETPVFFIFCIAAMSYADSLIKPAWNAVFKHNYTSERRSTLYSYASSLLTITTLLVTTLLGYLLDIDFRLYKILFPVAGLFDIMAYINLAKMISIGKLNEHNSDNKFTGKISFALFKDILILPVRNLLRIFRDNKPFYRFEIYFFLYGMAFMIASPAVPIFMVQTLHLDYSSISVARGLVFYTATILFTPVMGRLHGTGNPTRFCGYLFLALILYPLLMLSIKYLGVDRNIISPDTLLYITFFFFGIFMSGITISWNLSSIYYAPSMEVANYQAVHITLTGVRGIFAPFIGYMILKLVSIEATFIVSSLFFLFAGVMMLRESRK
ncbi:MAG: MFS transporter [Ignavibacteria bacterium]|nr:MFS transporter [Ignavibacteria bacterium]MBK8383627.1 MFS transporter [Ignavibacteria bacterium]MBK9403452.1 MFS transporter [Ignavibacteria bacterium]MBL0107292.1 MFS transporter [Ignavibacteria bacterium]